MSGCIVDVTSFNALLHRSAQVGDVETTRKFLQVMQDTKAPPNVDTYNAAIECFGRAEKSNIALQILNEMRMKGCSPNVVTYNSLLMALSTRCIDLCNPWPCYMRIVGNGHVKEIQNASLA